MLSYALIFPGQGSQTVGMLKELSERFPVVKKTFDQASSVLGEDLWDIAQYKPEHLDLTEITQPLMLTADIAVYRCLQPLISQKASIAAGHSLGEYAALVVGEALSFEQAVSLVKRRAMYMQEAVPVGVGAMAAVVGLEDTLVQEICSEAQQGQIVSAANFNSIGQIVIAGHREAVLRAIELAKSKKAKIARLIPVSVPSHCALMESAAKRLEEDLSKIEIRSPITPILHNATVEVEQNPTEIAKLLVKQLTAPVRWVETVQKILSVTEIFLECGPGKVLSGLIKRIQSTAGVLALDTPDGLQRVVEQMGNK